MGLFDGALGDVAGSLLGGQGGDAQQMLGGLLKQFGGGSNNALLGAAMALVQQQGGLEGLLQKFQTGGMGDLVQSWVGTGANLPISGDQLEQVLGHDSVAQAAAQAGVSATQAKDGLASLLPELVNQFTPGGSMPANSGALVNSVLGMLRG
jgi:uncharacterized protein YidB (DUF937 family)